jgi:hypothetical protein
MEGCGMSDIEREEFEQAVADKWSDSYKFTRFGDEDYYDEVLEGMWWGWQASRQALSSCSEIPNHSVTGNAVAMGDLIDNDDEEHERSILIQFGSLEDFYAARASGQCRFTLFGSGV